MPRLFLPSRSTDTTAALSLYRALLQQCRTVEATTTKASLRNVVHNRFRDNRAIVGVKSVKEAFEAGYEALTLLTTCNNTSPAGTIHLQQLLARMPTHLKKQYHPPSHPAPPPSSSNTPPSSSNTPPSPLPTSPSILQRPVPSTSHRRQIPIWVEANGIPFLRTRKPIPAALSAYLNVRIKHRQARTNSINYFEQFAMRLAQDEDVWDGIVRARGAEEGVDVGEGEGGAHAIGSGEGDGGGYVRGAGVAGVQKEEDGEQDRQRREKWIRSVKWVWGVRGIVEGLWDQVKAEKAKNLWWSRRLKQVVEKEKGLAVEEKREWVRKRRKEKRRAKTIEARVQEEERRFYAEREKDGSC